LFFVRESLIVGAVMTAVHLKKLWLIDTELTENLVRVASTGHILEGKSADLRIESGLNCSNRFCRFPKRLFFISMKAANSIRSDARVASRQQQRGFAPNRMARKHRALRTRV
jgi:hypothetical protein